MGSHTLSGFVKIKAINVYNACEACLDQRNARIAAEREQMVLELMLKEQVKFFTRRRYRLTREEAIAELKRVDDGCGWSKWAGPAIFGGQAAEEIAELWHAAQAADHESGMLVTAVNAARLLKFIKPGVPS